MDGQAARELANDEQRQMARRIRDRQWEIARKVDRLGTCWICWWDKARRHHPPADDVESCGLIDGMELLEWLHSHPDWWIIGKWDDARYAAPVALTDAGRAALANWEQFDMEPVTGGLVQPGWTAIPAAAGERQ